jgi:type IV conjugative transfer system protein TraL
VETIKIIKTLDNPLRFLYWEYPQVVFGGMGFCFGMLMQSLLLSVILLVLAMLLYKKIKSLIPIHFKRFSYWLFFPTNTKQFPPSYKRKFIR